MSTTAGATIFTFEPDRTDMQFETGIASVIALHEDTTSQTINREKKSREKITFKFRLSKNNFDELVNFFKARGGPETPFLIPSWTRDAQLTENAPAGSDSITVNSTAPFTSSLFENGNIIIIFNRHENKFQANVISSIDGNVLNLYYANTLSFEKGDEVFIAYPVRFGTDKLSRSFKSSEVYDVSIEFHETTDWNEIQSILNFPNSMAIEFWTSLVDASEFASYRRFDVLMPAWSSKSNQFVFTPAITDTFISAPFATPKTINKISYNALLPPGTCLSLYIRGASSQEGLHNSSWQMSDEIPTGPWYQLKLTVNPYDYSEVLVRHCFQSSEQILSNILAGLHAGWTVIAQTASYAVLKNPYNDLIKLLQDSYSLSVSCGQNWNETTETFETESMPTLFQYVSGVSLCICWTNERFILFDESNHSDAVYAGRLIPHSYNPMRVNLALARNYEGLPTPVACTVSGFGVLDADLAGITYHHDSLNLEKTINFEYGYLPNQFDSSYIGKVGESLLLTDQDTTNFRNVFGELIGVWKMYDASAYEGDIIDCSDFSVIKLRYDQHNWFLVL